MPHIWNHACPVALPRRLAGLSDIQGPDDLDSFEGAEASTALTTTLDDDDDDDDDTAGNKLEGTRITGKDILKGGLGVIAVASSVPFLGL